MTCMSYEKVALVTGGAQGIGKAITLHLLHHAYAVTIADVDAEAGQETVEAFGMHGPLQFVETDVADEQAVQRCIRQTIKQYGRLDALVNNAGIAEPHNQPVEQLALKHWQRVLEVNLTGCFLTAKHAVEHLRTTHGAIVNIASTRALQSEPHCEAYAASKGGIVALTHALALSLGPEIRVNCISPGWIDVSEWQKSSERAAAELRPLDHQQHPVGRVGQPQDVAAMVLFLLGPQAEFITGQQFIIDGGMTRKMIYAE